MSDSWFNIRATIEVRSEGAAFALVDKLYDDEEEGGLVASIDLTNHIPLVNITMEETPACTVEHLRERIVAAAEKCKLETVHVRFDKEFVWYSKIDVAMDS